MRIAGLILAGGESRRMGTDKALVTLSGRPMIEHVIARLGPQVEALAISANGDPARFGPALPVLPDARPQGPLSGISGLIWAAAQGASHLVSVPCDGPIFPDDLVSRLAAEAPEGGFAISTDLHPTHAIWRVEQAAGLQDFLASDAPKRLMAMTGPGRVAFPPGSFANANRPEDLAALERRLHV